MPLEVFKGVETDSFLSTELFGGEYTKPAGTKQPTTRCGSGIQGGRSAKVAGGPGASLADETKQTIGKVHVIVLLLAEEGLAVCNIFKDVLQLRDVAGSFV